MPQYKSLKRDEFYNVMPKKIGQGGYGMGVAPHSGYDNEATVIGLAQKVEAAAPESLGATTLKSLKTKDPVQYEWMQDPTPWKSTYKTTEKTFKSACKQKRDSIALTVDAYKTIKPTYTSGFACSEGQTSQHFGGTPKPDPPEAYNPDRLRAMKTKTPVEFYDLIRQNPREMTQTTTKNFQMLGAYPDDSKFYWTTKTAAGLM